MENNTAKNFALQLGSLLCLYLSLSFLLVLLFGIINILFPDAATDYWRVEEAHGNVRLGIAMVIVFFPTYLILTRLVNNIRRKETKGLYLGLTKWLIYLSLLVGGVVVLGDLVAIIMSFLEGEVTMRFILKAAAVFVVIGAALYYYILDAKNYWVTYEKKSVLFASIVSVLVLTSIVYGFTHIDTPQEVRDQKLDEIQITDLQSIQWQIQDYYNINDDKLPDSLAQLPNASAAPEERPAYTYEITDAGFKLCATFAAESTENDMMNPSFVDEKALIKNPDNWQHEGGEVCFERIVNKK